MLDVTPASAVPSVFELPLSVVEADIDATGHVNNIVYPRWVQEAATAHWNAAVTEQQKADYAWVVLRHGIDYLRPAVLGDELTARTYVGDVSGARFARHVWLRVDCELSSPVLIRAVCLLITPDVRSTQTCLRTYLPTLILVAKAGSSIPLLLMARCLSIPLPSK